MKILKGSQLKIRIISIGLFVHVPVFGAKSGVFMVQRGTFLMGNFMTCFQVERRHQGPHLASAISQVPSAKNNQDARVACFGVACFKSFHI